MRGRCIAKRHTLPDLAREMLCKAADFARPDDICRNVVYTSIRFTSMYVLCVLVIPNDAIHLMKAPQWGRKFVRKSKTNFTELFFVFVSFDVI